MGSQRIWLPASVIALAEVSPELKEVKGEYYVPAAALDAAQPKWQPIETAPKDGTYILLLGDSGYTTTPHRIAVGCWIEGYRDYWLTHSNDAFTNDGPPPTHWMFLPAPPEKEESI